VPKSLAEAGGFDQPDHTLRNRSTAGVSMGGMAGVQFGTSSAHEVKAIYLHEFFKAVDRGIQSKLSEDPQPLILAGVTREVSIYRRLSSYAPILSDAVHGGPDVLGTSLLFTKATQLMSDYSAATASETLAEMEEAAGRGLLITDPAAIIEASRIGQVSRLIVSTAGGCHEETFNWAALATIRGAGNLSVLQPSHLETGAAAILRFRQAAPAGMDMLRLAMPAVVTH
jgi:hypothetical protein